MSRNNDVDDERLKVLGQIAVMRERLDRLEAELIRLPMGMGPDNRGR
jgi:hypothetical protein